MNHLGRRILTTAFLPGVLGLSACAAPFDNQPINRPITHQFVEDNTRPRDIAGSNTVALSLSGGGMRAAAFSFGVLQALAAADEHGTDIFDDLTFISSVSGGALTGAYTALHGRKVLSEFRAKVLDRNLERDLRVSLISPANLSRLVAGGLNDRSNLAATLNREIFKGATFADLYRSGNPEVWINATDLYNRTPFPFIPRVFMGLCSDLSTLKVSEAVAASMAVPLVFTPVVLQTFPQACLTPLPPNMNDLMADHGSVAIGLQAASARAIKNYRDPQRMKYVKLVDGGLTDNQGLSSILVARAMSNTPYSPFTERDAVRMRHLLFLIVDAGRQSIGDWALQLEGPSGFDVSIAAVDTAIDSTTRLSAAAFRKMMVEWRDSIVRFRCSLDEAQVQSYLPVGQPWRCDDLQFFVGTVSAEGLDPSRAARVRDTPTRLMLPTDDLEAVVNAGRDAALQNPALRAYLHARLGAH